MIATLDLCPYCLDEIRRGVPEDGKCGHEHLLRGAVQHLPDCGTDREAKMTVVARDEAGKPTIWCDPCIVRIVAALNAAGIATKGSCCGHGHQPVWIALSDDTHIFIVTRDKMKQVCGLYERDINGHTVAERAEETLAGMGGA